MQYVAAKLLLNYLARQGGRVLAPKVPRVSACLKILLTGLPDDGDMLRNAAIVLAVAVGYDLYMLGGKYTSVANRMATSILRHFGLL